MALNSTFLSGVDSSVSAVIAVCVISVLGLLKYVSSRKIHHTGIADLPVLPELATPPKFETTDPDIVVVGGGVLGATFAARFGLDNKQVVMLERDLKTPKTFRGELLLPGSILALEKLGLKDALNDVNGNKVSRIKLHDVRLGGDPAIIQYGEPGGLAMRHGSLVDALRKAAMAQKSVTVIEGVGKDLLKENGRVVGVKYRVKGDTTDQEIRAPLVIVGDGYYSTLTKGLQTTHESISDSFAAAFFLKGYKHDGSIEYGLGHPNAQLTVFNLNEEETRCMLWIDGKTPSKNMVEFCRERVASIVPDHMKKAFLAGLKEEPQVPVIRCCRMAANFDYTPGVLVLGDALNRRHPITASGMLVALNDIIFWQNALVNTVKDLADDASILEQKLIFRTERQKWAVNANVLAEVTRRLLGDHDESMVKLQQFMIKFLRSIPKEDREKPNAVADLYGGVAVGAEVVKNVLNAILSGTIQEVYDSQPYIFAAWEAMKIRRKWSSLLKEVMTPETMI